jgi:hypothetical protein
MDDGTPAEGWEDELEHWLEPFLGRLRRQAQRRWAPVYLKGLLLPGERKSVEPMAARVAPADTQQLHHFVSTSPGPRPPWRTSWSRPPTGWWAGRTRCWSWTTPRSSSRAAARSG